MSLNEHRIEKHVLEKIESLLASLEFGTVQITVHDSQVTQVEKLEKHRFPLQSKPKQPKSNNRY